MANIIAKISSADQFSHQFKTIKQSAERVGLDFTAIEHYDYNDPIKIEEIYSALKSSKNTSPSEDRIQYKMIKQLSESGFMYLLYIFNKVWLEGVFPRQW